MLCVWQGHTAAEAAADASAAASWRAVSDFVAGFLVCRPPVKVSLYSEQDAMTPPDPARAILLPCAERPLSLFARAS